MTPLTLLDDWPVANVSAAWVDPHGRVVTHGDVRRRYHLASLTKLLTGAAVHIAHDEGTIDLAQPIDDLDGADGRDLLAHSSGLGPDDPTGLTAPHRRRMYSNAGYELIAERVAAAAGFPFADYLREAVFEPLTMPDSRLDGSPAAGATASVHDLVTFLTAVRDGSLLSAEAKARFTTAHLPALDGVLPGFGRHQPNPWGQGPEIRGEKSPHWTGTDNSPVTWGHFGQSGGLLWHDPVAMVSLIVLTDEPFGEWASARWPGLSDAVLSAG
ncbi:MAG: serine hydrolase domain-containing protein [Acidimicrobiales bacterium]